ncbi:MAG: hypothetical protein N2110_07265 [Flavobacteriales bacterium]|nr:hypothetical protein [Flavobacteriales bacterium]
MGNFEALKALENTWYLVASSDLLFTGEAVEDPVIRLAISRLEAPTLLSGYFKFKKKGYYQVLPFTLELTGATGEFFRLRWQQRLFTRTYQVKIVFLAQHESLLWYQEARWLSPAVAHLICATPHPEPNRLKAFWNDLPSSDKAACISLNLKPCVQRCERAGLTFLTST